MPGMSFSTAGIQHIRVTTLAITEDALTVELSDGRSISVPLSWYPRLSHATWDERNYWRLIGGGRGIHWPLLDEDVSVENLVFGKPSAESQASLEKWLDERTGNVGTDGPSGNG